MEEMEKNTVVNSKYKRLAIFWTRLILWLTFSCVIPICTFSIRFGLFQKNPTVTDSLGNVIQTPSVKLSGWGIIACILVWITVSSIIKEVIAAYPGYSLTKQWLTGFIKVVLPLITGFLACMFIKNSIEHLMFCLGTLALCQFIAVPLNPLPEWRYRKSGVEDYSSATSFLTKAVKRNSVDKET